MNHPFCVSKQESEQNEALSLVVTPKKKRHKVTDTRITPRTVSRILGQDGMGMSPASMEPTPCTSPRPPPYPQPPPPMLPVSLPTSVAIPNPGLHESQVFSPYSPFFHGPSHGHHMAMQVNIQLSWFQLMALWCTAIIIKITEKICLATEQLLISFIIDESVSILAQRGTVIC